jgi:hypothetical protein
MKRRVFTLPVLHKLCCAGGMSIICVVVGTVLTSDSAQPFCKYIPSTPQNFMSRLVAYLHPFLTSAIQQ